MASSRGLYQKDRVNKHGLEGNPALPPYTQGATIGGGVSMGAGQRVASFVLCPERVQSQPLSAQDAE